MATSPQAKCLVVSNAVADGTVSSRDLKKPKKQSVAAAHNMIKFWVVANWSQEDLILRNMDGVIGKRIRGLVWVRYTTLLLWHRHADVGNKVVPNVSFCT